MMPLPHALLAFAAAFAAGAINSVAGGGTLVSFPTLVWLGLPSITANATSTVAIVPGSLGGVWGFRRELRTADRTVFAALVAPSIAGGIAGAILLRMTPTDLFDRLVPFLIFFATCLFMAQERVQRLFQVSTAKPGWLPGAFLFQLLVGMYGGYFGAGIGILMLAALSVLGLTDIHQMNGLKNLLAFCINAVASLYFVWMAMVGWPYVTVMAVGAVAGGIGGAGMARRVGRRAVRRFVIAIGFAMAISLMLKG